MLSTLERIERSLVKGSKTVQMCGSLSEWGLVVGTLAAEGFGCALPDERVDRVVVGVAT